MMLLKNPVLKNASWIIACNIVQSVLGLLVGVFTARYLGPSNYGTINYAASITAFAAPIMYLGLNATLVQEIVSQPEQEGKILGTSLVMNFGSSLLCIVGIFAFVSIANRSETETIIVCTLYSLLLIFQAFEILQYWFQAKLKSKYTSITMFITYLLVSAYKIFLLATEKSIYWFAVSNALDYFLISLILLIIYRKISTQKLSFSLQLGKTLFSKSKYYILSGMMVTIFANTDRIMLKLMVDESATGYYAAAVTCASITSFFFSAIIDSARPAIFEGKQLGIHVFEKRIKLLYAIVIFMALLQSVGITIFAKLIVNILYGAQYSFSIDILRILVWYTTFSYIGAIRDIWILSEGKQRILLIINLFGAVTNIILNSLLIPLWGGNGAAVASLITQIFTNVILGFIIKPLRKNNYLMCQSLNPRILLDAVTKRQKDSNA